MCSAPSSPAAAAPVTPASAPAPPAAPPAATPVGAARKEENVSQYGTVNGPTTRVDRSVALGGGGNGTGLNL
jgi:hypothetical protein